MTTDGSICILKDCSGPAVQGTEESVLMILQKLSDATLINATNAALQT